MQIVDGSFAALVSARYLMAPTDMATLWSLVMGSMLAMAATPRPASPTSCADTPSSNSSAVGSCRVPSLFFSFTTWSRAVNGTS